MCHPRRHAIALTALAISLGLAATAGADGAFQLNSYTTGDQVLPALSATPDGGFVAVWDSEGSFGSDDSLTSIQAQRLSPSGARIGAQFQVNGYGTGLQIDPDVSVGRDGSFVVAWESAAHDGPGADGTLARRFSSTGLPIGANFQVHTYTTDDQEQASVAVGPAGDFLVVWAGDGTHDRSGIHARWFDADGDPSGSDLAVNVVTQNVQNRPDVAALEDGSFVVTWDSVTYQGSLPDFRVVGRRVASFGAVGDEFVISPQADSVRASVAVASGKLYAVWDMTPGASEPGQGIAARPFAPDGSPLGPIFAVNSETLGPQVSPRITANHSGRALATWLSSPDGELLSIKARFLDETGPIGDEILVDESRVAIPSGSVVEWSNAGTILVAWHTKDSPEDGSGFGIRGMLLADPYYVFSDGFESGAAGEWDAVAPAP